MGQTKAGLGLSTKPIEIWTFEDSKFEHGLIYFSLTLFQTRIFEHI